MHSKVGLYRKKLFNPLDSSQRLRLLNTSYVCFIEIGEKPVIYLKYNVYFIEIGENSVLYLKYNVYFIEKKKENGYNLRLRLLNTSLVSSNVP
jgi:hypothetical protein